MKDFLLFSLLLLTATLLSAQSAIYSSASAHHPIVAQDGMVATQHHLATDVGVAILEAGGNAVDAAVGVGFALAVVLPRAGNLGGGGFMLVHDAETSKTTAINYREKAPAAAHRNMYLDAKGEVDSHSFNSSYLSVGVPGTVAGLLHALDKYGTMTVDQVIAPAILLAENGFAITHDLAALLSKYKDRLSQTPASSELFYPEGTAPKAHDLLVQKDLAWSLRQIAKRGHKGFYEGPLAKKLVADMKANGGIINKKDLKKYKVSETPVVSGTYRGYEIASMPPPSSGGVHLIQILNILEAYDIQSSGHNSAETIHLMVEAMRRAYADRSEHLGDPAFWDVPVKGLTSKAYSTALGKTIDSNKASLSDDIKPGQPEDYESEETTHFSVVDKWGNAVSNTYTLNFSFGTGLVAAGTGILLNNEMGDFSAKPGVANAYGLIGGEANAVQAGKQPLSSMTPTIVLKDGQPILVTGSPGGSRIITTVLQIIMNVVDHEMNIAEASHASRIHHQWYPDKLYYEKYFNVDTQKILMNKGHHLEQRAAMGSTQSIHLNNGLLYGASDPRRPDASTRGL
jgi:gamma-glutamyltranspeptidase/glutathione hydrolase